MSFRDGAHSARSSLLALPWRIRRKSTGELRWVEFKGQADEAPGHGGLRVVGISADITARREAAAQRTR